MKSSLIQPDPKLLPSLGKRVFLFPQLGELFSFRELAQGGKLLPFGPCKCFHFTHQGHQASAIGGLLGAGLMLMGLEQALTAGGREFFALGQVGWIGQGDWSPGQVFALAKSHDATGSLASLGVNPDAQSAHPWPQTKAKHLLSVAQPFGFSAKLLEQFHQQGFSLLDMELAPAAGFLAHHQLPFSALAVVSEGFKDLEWLDQRSNPKTAHGLEQALRLLLG